MCTWRKLSFKKMRLMVWKRLFSPNSAFLNLTECFSCLNLASNRKLWRHGNLIILTNQPCLGLSLWFWYILFYYEVLFSCVSFHFPFPPFVCLLALFTPHLCSFSKAPILYLGPCLPLSLWHFRSVLPLGCSCVSLTQHPVLHFWPLVPYSSHYL